MQDILSSYFQLIKNQLKIAKLESKLSLVSIVVLLGIFGFFVGAMLVCWLLLAAIAGVVLFSFFKSILIVLFILLGVHLALLLTYYINLKQVRKNIGFKKTQRHFYKLMIHRKNDEKQKENAAA